MKIFVSILLLLLLISAFTVPDTVDHREKVKEELGIILKSSEGSFIYNVPITVVVQYLVKSRKYLLFSTTVISTNKGEQVIGIGLYNNVFIFKHKLLTIINPE